MDSLQLFTQSIPELESLPSQPRIYWYPSAGIDFRGPVAFTNFRIQNQKIHHGRDYVKPDLFIFNCLGPEVIDLRNKLEQGVEVELFNDNISRIVAKNYRVLEVRNEISFEINPSFIDIEILNLDEYQTNIAFYFEFEVFSESYCETQKILYFKAENIDFFEKIILTNIFETSYLCNTREGLSWGGCNKSIIEHIYNDNHPHFFTTQGFKPTFNILSNNFTKELFETVVEGSISTVPYYGNYISESEQYRNDSIIYKLSY